MSPSIVDMIACVLRLTIDSFTARFRLSRTFALFAVRNRKQRTLFMQLNSKYLHSQLLLIAVLLILSLPGFAAPVAQVGESIDKILASPSMAHGIQGVYIQSMDSGKIIYNHNGDLLLTPASNMKMIATAAALDLLGTDYRMTTSIFAVKPGKDGVVRGDLVIVGGGDSTLTTDDLQKMIDDLKSKGIKSIRGNIVGDDTYFDDQRRGDSWTIDDDPWYYAAQISGLCVNRNVVDVYLKPGARIGSPAIIEVKPDIKYMTFRNECITGAAGSESTAGVTRELKTNIIQSFGSLPLDYKSDSPVEKITVDEPTLYVSALFRAMLIQNGIKVRGKAMRGTKPADAELIVSHDSPALSELVKLLNKPSDNFMAECLMKTIGKKLGTAGSTDAGADVVYKWLKSFGADTDLVAIADSSGLSRRNLVAPQLLVSILTHMYKTKAYDAYSNSFPIAGVDSHLKDRMLNSPAVNNVKAKTGYIRYVCSLSGYVKTLSGENLAVSIILNHHRCELAQAYEIQDAVFVALASSN